MSETTKTPLEKLDDAVRDFCDSTSRIPGTFVTGWTVVASTGRIQSDEPDMLPLVTGARYVLGPATSVVQAAGLARFLDVVCERATYQMLDNGEADDEDDEGQDA